MQLKTIIIMFNDINLNAQEISKIRGAIASKFPQFALLHNHIAKSKLLYLYPKIQYKMLNNTPVIVGLKEGINTLKEIYSDLGSFKINGRFKKPIRSEIQMEIFDASYGRLEYFIKYRFESLWLPLNDNNYKKYQRLGTWHKRKAMLEKILIGNILSMSKGVGYTVPGPIEANIIEMKEVPARLKGTPMLGFIGTFSVNFEIPDYFGIGKSVSRGFGTVKRIQ